MSDILHIDYETRSACDIREAGAEVYARHPTTDFLCLAWSFGDDAHVGLVTREDPVLPPQVEEHIRRGGLVYAHSAQFELAITNNIMAPRYGWPALDPKQCRCTAAMAYAMALPGSLDNASQALGLTEGKDQQGYRLMLQLSKPRRVEPCPCEGQHGADCAWCGGDCIVWWEDADKLERLYAYCRQDVVVERELHRRMMDLSPQEILVWQLDYAINQRGVAIDVPAVEAAKRLVDLEKIRLDALMREATGHQVASCTEVGKLTAWVKAQGVETDGLAKADVVELLERDDLPPQVGRALLLRKEAGKSSTSKLGKMLVCLCPDNRVRGIHQYHGAGPGRWAGRLIQLQNYMRPPKWLEDADLQIEVIDRILDTEDPALIDVIYGPPMDVVAGVMRGFIVPAPGHDFIAVDYSNIEGRKLAWLAGEEWKLEAFRAQDAGTGPEVYLVAAGRVYDTDPSTYTKKSPERQVGKTVELACGFGGSVGSFHTMGRTYGVKVSDEDAKRIVDKWRDAHRATVKYWYALEEAAISACLNPGKVFRAGAAGREVRYRTSGSFLWCQLPSGRVICYPYPEIRSVTTPWGASKEALTYMFVPNEADKRKGKLLPDSKSSSRWVRGSTYGGSLSENVTQASASCLLRNGMLNCESANYPISFHVHDEAVAEVPTGWGSVEEMGALMTRLPAWAAGLPVTAEGFRAPRYRK